MVAPQGKSVGFSPGWTRMLSLLAELYICACVPAQLADLAVLCE